MATTPIDQLVVVLGLDSAPLVRGLRNTTDAFRRAKEDIREGAKDVEDGSRSAGYGIAALRLGVAGLGVALGLVAARDLKEWVRQMTAAGSATERLAFRTNTTVGNVTTLRGAVRQAGGTFEDADATLSGLVNSIARLNLYGDVSKFPQLSALGVNIANFDTNKADDVIRLIEALSKAAGNRPNRAETATLLADIGISQGGIDLILRGNNLLERRLAYARQFAGANQTASEWARQVDEEFARIEVVTEAIRSKIYSWVSPTVLANMKRFVEGPLNWVAEKMGASSGGTAPTTAPRSVATMPIMVPGGSGGGITPVSGGLARITTAGGKSVTVAAGAAPAFKGFLESLERAGAPLGELGGYNYRNIAGTNTLSEHAKGLAIDMGSMRGRDDIDPALRSWIDTHQTQWRAALAQHGMRSGGDFRQPDLGHVEYTTNINVTTQPGANAKAIGAETAAQAKRALMAAGANGGDN